ncbi:MAG: cytochrome c3 family protein [Bacteroidales bacterium]
MKIKNAILTLCFAASIQFAFGQSIIGSKHDFSTSQWNTSGEICKVCHTPHGGAAVANAPLWSHPLSTATYTVYSSPTLNAGTPAGTLGQPSASTKLCLSCHDNTVAVGGTTFIQDIGTPQGYANVGIDLSNDHPVSFTYDAALVALDPGLKPITSPSGIGSGTIESNMLFGGKMECASCHDVHNGYGYPHLLVKNNNASALCLTCHNK